MQHVELRTPFLEQIAETVRWRALKRAQGEMHQEVAGFGGDRDHRLVVISAPMKRDGFYPEVLAAFEQMPRNAAAIAANIKASPLAAMYPKTNWEASFRKMSELASVNFDWTHSVEAINAPTLLMFADADAIRVDHIAAFYQALGGGRRDAGQ